MRKEKFIRIDSEHSDHMFVSSSGCIFSTPFFSVWFVLIVSQGENLPKCLDGSAQDSEI